MKDNHPILSGLVKLHAELGGKILENKKQAAKLAEEMRHLEAVIRMFQPDYDTRRIAARRRYKGNPLFKRGTLFRAALDVLRKADEPLATTEIARRMLLAKGVASPAPDVLRSIFGGVHASLRNHAGKSVVMDDSKTPMRWVVKP
jgi:hypothetical protein